MFFHITVYAKEKTTLQNFFIFFTKLNVFNLNFTKKIQKKNKHKFITILKSPHVNKTAQEQFEYKFFSSQFVFYPNDLFLSFIILKQVLKKAFPGLKIKILCNFDKKKQIKKLLNFLDPNNVVFRNKTTKKKNQILFFMFDSFGEISLQNFKIIP